MLVFAINIPTRYINKNQVLYEYKVESNKVQLIYLDKMVGIIIALE